MGHITFGINTSGPSQCRKRRLNELYVRSSGESFSLAGWNKRADRTKGRRAELDVSTSLGNGGKQRAGHLRVNIHKYVAVGYGCANHKVGNTGRKRLPTPF